MDLLGAINSYLDALPRPRLAAQGREVPAFRTCGIVGFYVALVVLIGAGLLTGRSLAVLMVLALVNGLSFYVYAFLRKWITGREELVLLEQVWFAIAASAGALYLLDQPLLGYLDVISVALCPFLAAGRAGCTLVGCCHGNPSSLGITYNDACVNDGFSAHLVGIRLFPAAAIEGVGLLLIGVCGLIALPFAAPGKVFAWYLLAYAIMRFGLEGIRGDYRPHFLGLSQARWMAIMEVGVALILASEGSTRRATVVYAVAFSGLTAVLAIRWAMHWRRRLLTRSHLNELHELVREEMANRKRFSFTRLKSAVTSQGVTVGISAVRAAPNMTHISLSLPRSRRDLRLLCELAATAFPQLLINSAQGGGSGVVHFVLAEMSPANGAQASGGAQLARAVYGNVVRRLQANNKPDIRGVVVPERELSPALPAPEAAETRSQNWPLRVARDERQV